MTIKILIISILLTNYLLAGKIIINNLEERSFSTTGLSYILKASQKTIDTKKLKKINLFNRRKILSNALYYSNGALFKKNIKVNFKKGYFLEGDFYMHECYSSYKGIVIKSTSAKYHKSYIEFSGIVMKENNKIYHKFKYRVDTN